MLTGFFEKVLHIRIKSDHMFYIRIADEYNNEQTFPVPQGGLKIGRSVDCDVVLETAGISREHARIGIESGQCYVRDVGSKNGLLVNGERTHYHWLRDGDEIKLPHNLITFRCSKSPIREAAGVRSRNELASEMEHLAGSEKKRRHSISDFSIPHPYVIAALLLVPVSAFHWAFALSSVILAAIALREMRTRGNYRGRALAGIALCGAICIGGANMFLQYGGFQAFYEVHAVESQCRENLESIWNALQRYKQDHGGGYPEELIDLYPGYVSHGSILVCPGRAKTESRGGYKYAGRRASVAGADDIIVIDDAVDNHERTGALALYGDGSVERIRVRDYEYMRLRYRWLE